MVEIRDWFGRLACMGDEMSGKVEVTYKGCQTVTVLGIGGVLEITRQGTKTRITRISKTRFAIQSIVIVA